MNQIILADEQAIFRAGAARTLALEEDMRIVAQCDDTAKLRVAIETYRFAIVLYSTGLGELAPVLTQAREARCPVIAIPDKRATIAEALAAQLGGVITRSTTAPELIDTVRRVARGQRGVQLAPVRMMQAPGHSGRARAGAADAEGDADRRADRAGLQEPGDCGAPRDERAGGEELPEEHL